MRHSFEQNLRGYGEAAKDRVSGALTPEQEKELAGEIAGKIRRAAIGRKSTPEAQMDIYFIQEKKQQIMDELYDRLDRIDELERRDYEKLVIFEEGRLVVKGAYGEADESITKGEVITDMEWGNYYYLDPATVDLKIRKRYLIEDAKQTLMEKLDEQITLDETSSQTSSDATKAAYRGRAEATGGEAGFVAETMVKNFLKKLSYDYDVDFAVFDADAHQDVSQKMDFIIRRMSHKRGVGVQEADVRSVGMEKVDIERVGVQFTIDTDEETKARKLQQIQHTKELLKPGDHIDDVVLVTVPSESVREAYRSWKLGRRPGGPDKLWDMDTKERIFRLVMQGILEPGEIDAEWSKVSGGGGAEGAMLMAA